MVGSADSTATARPAPDTTVGPRPRRSIQIATLCWAVVVILAAAFGHTAMGEGAPLFLFGLLLGLGWCGNLIVEWGLVRLDWRSAVAWSVCPATLLLLGFFIYFSPWPLVLRVKLSESALLRVVEEVRAGRTRFDPPVRAVLFSIDSARIRNGTVLLDTNESWPLESAGIAYVGDDPRWLDFGEDGSPPPPFCGSLFGRWSWFRYPD